MSVRRLAADQPEGFAFTPENLEWAKAQIKKLNLNMGKITYKKDMKSLPNSVLSQSPSAGTGLKGQTVDLVLSK